MAIRPYAFLGIAAAIACAGVVFTGCGGGGTSTGTAATGTSVKTSAPQNVATKASIPDGAPQIDQKNLTFIPNKLTVKTGDTVYFLNSETVIHTVVIDGKNISGDMKQGQVVTWKATKAGEYKVTCIYHPAMNATITVQ